MDISLQGHRVLLHLPSGGPDGPALQGGGGLDLGIGQQVNICMKWTFRYLYNLALLEHSSMLLTMKKEEELSAGFLMMERKKRVMMWSNFEQ